MAPTKELLEHVQIITKYAYLRAGHQFHQNKLAWKDIKDWLVDGGHKMYKVPIDDQ